MLSLSTALALPYRSRVLAFSFRLIRLSTSFVMGSRAPDELEESGSEATMEVAAAESDAPRGSVAAERSLGRGGRRGAVAALSIATPAAAAAVAAGLFCSARRP